jgi:hypothetical protein
MTFTLTLTLTFLFFLVALPITVYLSVQLTERRAARRAIAERLERLLTEDDARVSLDVFMHGLKDRG